MITVVSGGQTGVDRAALDAAMELGLPVGGWCPAGRAAEDGTIDLRYPLVETPSADPAQRTEWNVRDSDATLILDTTARSGGTALTRQWAERLGKPLLACGLDAAGLAAARSWLAVTEPRRLNVAGPRASEAAEIYGVAREFLLRLLAPSCRHG